MNKKLKGKTDTEKRIEFKKAWKEGMASFANTGRTDDIDKQRQEAFKILRKRFENR